MNNKQKIEKALELAMNFGSIDGSHHKMWVIDQIVRALSDDDYDKLIAEFCNGEDGRETYSWDCGIAP